MVAFWTKHGSAATVDLRRIGAELGEVSHMTDQQGASAPKKNWAEAIASYRHPRVLVMLFLGFAAGLPFLLIFSTLSTWLREAEVSRTAIGYFSWVGIMFSIKGKSVV